MTIEEIIKKQQEFDKEHKSNFDWSQKIDDKNIEVLQFLLLSMVGEFGEASNLIKKVVRGDCQLKDIKNSLSEEIIDILIYVIKIIYQLDINLEEEYIKKMEKNKLRFEKYKKENK
jgi:NTP pyrophosphatase (non-canonical NTP hydrolase)